MSFEHFLLQTGHAFWRRDFQNFSKQSLQRLWLQVKRTGSLKISQHTGQLRSSSEKGVAITSLVWRIPQESQECDLHSLLLFLLIPSVTPRWSTKPILKIMCICNPAAVHVAGSLLWTLYETKVQFCPPFRSKGWMAHYLLILLLVFEIWKRPFPFWRLMGVFECLCARWIMTHSFLLISAHECCPLFTSLDMLGQLQELL